MKIKVFQIKEGLEGSPEYNAQRDAFMYGMLPRCNRETVEGWLKTGLYEHVATVEADHVEQVFVIMNRWADEDEARVERHRLLHSLSVRDVVVLPDGSRSVVASFGFDELAAETV